MNPENPNESKIVQGLIKTGQLAFSAIATAAIVPSKLPNIPPTKAIARLLPETGMRFGPTGADRDTQPDFARSLGHRNDHDVHDADAAHRRETEATAINSKSSVRTAPRAP